MASLHAGALNFMDYFGDKLEAPIYWHADKVDTPVGKTCWWCQNEIEDGDQGFRMPDVTPESVVSEILSSSGRTSTGIEVTISYVYIHRRCFLRSVLGPAADAFA
jgi:hypothetical protein